MNPLTNVKNLNKLNQRELELGLTAKKSWHDKYKDSAWIFVGGLPYDLTEGDILCIFSQYGEIVNINLVRDQKTGKQKGFCFLCYEDQRSTILAVDNFNGAKVLGRVLRVDHVEEYKKPKEHSDEDDLTKKVRLEGCAPKIESSPEPEEDLLPLKEKKVKKSKKEKKEKKKQKKKKKEKQSSSDESSDSEESDRVKKRKKMKDRSDESVNVKKEKHDSGYDRALKGDVPGVKRRYSDSDSEVESQGKYSNNGGHLGNRDFNEKERNSYRDRYENTDYSARRTENDQYDKQRDSYGTYRERDNVRSRESEYRRDFERGQGQRSNRDQEMGYRSREPESSQRNYENELDQRRTRDQERGYERNRDYGNDGRNDRNSSRDSCRNDRGYERSRSREKSGRDNRERNYDRNNERDRKKDYRR